MIIKNRGTSVSSPSNTAPFNCFIHNSEHLTLCTWKTNLTDRYRLPKVIPWAFSLRPYHLVSWGKGRAMVQGKICPFVLHIWSLFTAGLLPTSMQPQKGAFLFLPHILCTPVLQARSATLPQLMISSSAIPPSRHPLATNQSGCLLTSLKYLFCTQMRMDIPGDACNRTESICWDIHLFLYMSSKKIIITFIWVSYEKTVESSIFWPGKGTSFISSTDHAEQTHMCVTVLMRTYRQVCVPL